MAACAKHALIQAIQKFSVLDGLTVLHIDVFLWSLALQEWLDLLVLCIEVGHVYNKVLKDEHEHERRDNTLLIVVLWNTTEAGQVMTAVNIH